MKAICDLKKIVINKSGAKDHLEFMKLSYGHTLFWQKLNDMENIPEIIPGCRFDISQEDLDNLYSEFKNLNHSP